MICYLVNAWLGSVLDEVSDEGEHVPLVPGLGVVVVPTPSLLQGVSKMFFFSNYKREGVNKTHISFLDRSKKFCLPPPSVNENALLNILLVNKKH